MDENKVVVDGVIHHVDILLPRERIVIEFDGSYWHKESPGRSRQDPTTSRHGLARSEGTFRQSSRRRAHAAFRGPTLGVGLWLCLRSGFLLDMTKPDISRLLAFVLAPLLLPMAAHADASVDILVSGDVATTAKAADPIAVSRAATATTGNTKVSQGTGGEASADLAAGTVRARVVGTVVAPLYPTQWFLPRAIATINDTITVSGPGTTVMVNATLHVDGLLGASGTPGTNPFLQTDIQAKLTLGSGASLGAVAERFIQQHQPDPVSDTLMLSTIAPPSSGTVSGSNFTMTLVRELPFMVGKPVQIGASLIAEGRTSAELSAIVDAGNTARLSISLPNGYTYTSASGVLLSQAGNLGLGLPGDGGVGQGGTDGGSTVDAGVNDLAAGSGDGLGEGDAGTTSPSSGGCAMSPQPSVEASVFLAIAALIVVARRRRAS